MQHLFLLSKRLHSAYAAYVAVINIAAAEKEIGQNVLCFFFVFKYLC